jgi:hypothetical protein
MKGLDEEPSIRVVGDGEALPFPHDYRNIPDQLTGGMRTIRATTEM